MSTFTLKSKDLGGQLAIQQYARGMGFNGENLSPQLYWENAPANTQSFAVTIYDLDAPAGSGFIGAAPNDGPAHRYLITVHALSSKLNLDRNVTPAYLGFNMPFVTLAKASLIVYGQKQ